MNTKNWIIGSLVALMTSCNVKEEVHINKDNSVDRDMQLHLDKDASQKLLSMASTLGMQEKVNMDSLGYVWQALSDTVKKNTQTIPGAALIASAWDSSNHTGTMKFHLASLQAYNQLTSNSFALPAEANNQVPLGGMKKQKLEWHGKDTLVIQLDNSKDAGSTPAASSEEMMQGLNMLKGLMGIDALMDLKAIYHLPKPAKSIIGANATLSEDRKSITITQSLDEANAANQPDIVKVVF
ncbi:hypothetical protein SAMN05421788_101633 [Filimonas lacunae]|uniref:Lipoprotein n=1 Tax=Filimonas lacunae TaxID=477680 RepID=A0A173MP17_9BACT|nr:hypothetical protein [Filimonas lacunae]BAV09190.1 hypothetical protein FLA_5238 [Filimonas lacunae]SIS68691.1 hypothetical protein SAMN05421788_101633 [Filimonas lacunae]